MITEQIITYIKDQLARGMSRDKIRSNLLAAGWMEEDIKQAFSFAQPNGEPAALKIAPAFAAQDIIDKEISVDKTDLIKNDEPFIPVLKRDPEAKPAFMPIRPADEKIMTMNIPEMATAAPANILVTRTTPPAVSTLGNGRDVQKIKSSFFPFTSSDAI